MVITLHKGRTAFLVIHGIGEQVPFESMDGFTRGLMQHLKQQFSPASIQIAHHLIERQNPDRTAWTESFVRLSSAVDPDWSIDIHEYYWANLTEGLITVPQVWQWLEQTLRGTQHFYESHKTLQQELFDQCSIPQPSSLGASTVTRSWYRLSRVIWHLRVVYPLIRLALFLTPQWPYWQPLQLLRNWLDRRATKAIVGYIGDVAIYTSLDRKSRYFKVRQSIIHGAQTLLESILADQTCDRVVVAGHSLGSVIAYDALNQLNIKANLVKARSADDYRSFEAQLDKLQGLITFGSPLDKVAFFFQEQLGRVLNRRPAPKEGEALETPYVRSQLLGHLHSFKVRRSEQPLGYSMLNPVQEILADPLKPKAFHWVNFYDCKDPISGHLHYYRDLENIRLELSQPWGYAHNGYWQHAPFYQSIAERFLCPALSPATAIELPDTEIPGISPGEWRNASA